ncbi:rhoptry protein RHOP148, putative [Babesia caballi]|uniref:Rhoptry protein RHOP148, putative n=1 Tax=Babesia caballi TaxID=5871 RepID=A0AAV4LL57_BABCB|nr:rhoptry protein RHOP148, putative [Babesia caballi]
MKVPFPNEGVTSNVNTLKELLQSAFLSHFDLCVIFLLLLRGELDLYDSQSARALLSLLVSRWPTIADNLKAAVSASDVVDGCDPNAVTGVDNSGDSTNDGFNSDVAKPGWKVSMRSFLKRLRLKFGGFGDRTSVCESQPLELSKADYEYCSSCLGREASGVVHLLRRCVCNAKSAAETNLPCHSSILNVIGEDGIAVSGAPSSGENCNSETAADKAAVLSTNVDESCARLVEAARNTVHHASRNVLAYNYRTGGCATCSKCAQSDRVVAVISPFVMREGTTYAKGSRRSIKRSIRSASGELPDIDYPRNVELYTSHEYPLHSYLVGGSDPSYEHVDGSAADGESSEKMANSIYDIVEAILSPVKGTVSDSPREAYVLARLISSKVANDGYSGDTSDSSPCGDSTENISGIAPLEFCKEVESKLLEAHGGIFDKFNELVPFPTTYWLTDPGLLAQVSALEGSGAITRLQEVIDEHIRAYEQGQSEESAFFLKQLISDNLGYICSRFELVHPSIMRALYTLIVNSKYFSQFYSGDAKATDAARSSYIFMLPPPGAPNINPRCKGQPPVRRALSKALAIANTLRAYGVGGSRSFVHIKCLHTHIAFALAECSTVGGWVISAL